MLAHHWSTLGERHFSPEAVDALVIDPIIASISSSSLKLELLRNIWRAADRTRTDLLAQALDRRFFGGQTLESLDKQCRWIFNASNLVTGVRFAFERDYLGDYVTGLAPTADTKVSLSTAVAASAAVPGAFAPLRLRGIDFPCSPVDDPALPDPLLLDGGVYDNTGLTALDGDEYHDLFFVCLNAGGVFPMGRPLPIPIVGAVKRAEAVLYRQSATLQNGLDGRPLQGLPAPRRSHVSRGAPRGPVRIVDHHRLPHLGVPGTTDVGGRGSRLCPNLLRSLRPRALPAARVPGVVADRRHHGDNTTPGWAPLPPALRPSTSRRSRRVIDGAAFEPGAGHSTLVRASRVYYLLPTSIWPVFAQFRAGPWSNRRFGDILE